MEALLDGLNDAQRSAVTSPASVLQVLAPPGSGKTKTLTARVAYMVNHERLQPWNIIVCTFTIKAAHEMKERICGFVGEGIEKKLILGTFHSVARRFLVRYGQEIGIPKNFGIADTTDSKSIIKRIIDTRQYLVPPDQARSRISGLKARNISAEQFAATQKKADEHEFANVYFEYEEQLKSQNLLDYDDLLVRCVELLRKHPQCVSSIQAVLIDEYQDTNNVQYELMKLLAQERGRITIVGDPDQSIYSFRAAEIKNLFKMRKDYPDSSVINLEMNYRSSGCILTTAMAVIEQDESRPDKPLIATHCVGEQPTLRHLATAQVEAWWIVDEIQRTTTLAAGLLDHNDYAILIRSAALSLSIERALAKAGIPYRMVGGLRFFDRAEIKLVLDYLRIINQPESNDVLMRIINRPSRKIGESTVKALVKEAEEEKISFWKLILAIAQGRKKARSKIAKPAQLGIETFVNLVLTSQKKLQQEDSCDLLGLIDHVSTKINLEAYLKSTYKDDWKERWANYEELVSQATQMATSVANGEEVADDALPIVEGIEQRQDTAADILSKFLANVTLSSAVEQPNGEEVSQVTISTIHAAKGLEWPVVFIPAVYMGSIPHSRAEDHDEERRLLYVGMTRAKGLLYLSCPVKLASSDDTVLSKFVDDASIQKLFSRSGPSMGSTAIRDLAQILGRACPLATEVQIARSLVERIEDDKFPYTRDEIDGTESWSNFQNGWNTTKEPWAKRTKVDHSTREYGGVMYDVVEERHPEGEYTMSMTNASRNAGFTSARDVRALQQEAENARMLASANAAGKHTYSEVNVLGTSTRPVYKEVNRLGTSSAPPKKSKPRVAGQGSITGFFKRSASSMSEEQDPIPIPKPQPTPRNTPATFTRPLADVSNRQPHSHPSRSYRPYQPPSFPTHTLHTAPMSTKPRKAAAEERLKHVLLSSSPTKPDNEPILISSEDKDRPSEPATSGFRPAATLHTTSMGALQQGGSGPGGVQRRTLGARRSMQGWSVKHSAPPRPKGS
ncbi:UvrD-helicase-domain-containing protein [Karstenula rhodostoma CBS 690.94]|uniref:DNA 3'-5' helicase n=1 Tax=Karstenula rhodostoma CBS 690.94 TaxID=1392251 RepID=A0A9P4U6V0_9PLEO|nr:UvrD-helicase-domain-containing protein [Karstenula rhodostoma CBS 690.94]